MLLQLRGWKPWWQREWGERNSSRALEWKAIFSPLVDEDTEKVERWPSVDFPLFKGLSSQAFVTAMERWLTQGPVADGGHRAPQSADVWATRIINFLAQVISPIWHSLSICVKWSFWPKAVFLDIKSVSHEKFTRKFYLQGKQNPLQQEDEQALDPGITHMICKVCQFMPENRSF